jgi:hypothetical protein
VGSVEKKTFLSAICSRIRCNSKGRFCPPISRVLAFEVELHRVVVAAAGSDGRRVADVFVFRPSTSGGGIRESGSPKFAALMTGRSVAVAPAE